MWQKVLTLAIGLMQTDGDKILCGNWTVRQT